MLVPVETRDVRQERREAFIIHCMSQLLPLSLWLIRRRFRRAWALTAVIALGILAAVTLLSTTALYSQAQAETGVRHALFTKPPTASHVQALFQNRPVGPEDYESLQRVAEESIQGRLGDLVVGWERFGRSQAGMPLTAIPERRPPPLDAPSGRLFFMTGFTDHSRILRGTWPQTGGTSEPGGVELEAVVGARVAKDMGLDVGTLVFITPFRGSPEERITLEIVGVAEPLNPRDEYWMGLPDQFGTQSVGDELVIPHYVTEGDFLNVVGRRFPIVVGDFGFNVFIDPSGITAKTVDSTQEALDGLETDLNKVYPRTFLLSRLGLTLDEFERELLLARVPVYVYVSLVVILILYFLSLITIILGRSQGEELNLLRSRGASVLQVCGVMLLTECALALVAVAVGPLLAWLIVRSLLLPTFGDVGGGPVELPLTANVFWMGALGAVLSVAVLSASAFSRARMEVSEAMGGRSRPPFVSFVHRYYLDLVVVLAVGFLLWQFQERDGFVSRSVEVRGLDVDPFLIAGPVLALLASGLLLMRLLPLVARAVVLVCMRVGPGWSSVSLARLARDPVLPSSLAVMLMLAAALGVFGATFQSSLSQSQSHQTQYRIGGDVVVSGPGVGAELADDLEEVFGVQSATPILRDSVNLVVGHATAPALLIAGEPEALAQSSWFRDDFAGAALPDIAAQIKAVPSVPSGNGSGVALPAGLERIGVWANTGSLEEHELHADINVWAKVTNSTGRYWNVSLGGFGGPRDESPYGWRLFSGDLPGSGEATGEGWSLVAIFFTTSSFVKVPAGRIDIDDLTVFGPGLAESGVVLDTIDSPGGWRPFGTGLGAPDRLENLPGAARTGTMGLAFSWVEPFRGGQRGIHVSPFQLPLPAIGGPGLRSGQSLQIQHGTTTVPIEVVGTAELFPTITSFRRPFLILDLDAYLSYLRLLPPGGLDTAPQAIWLSLAPGQDRETVLEGISESLPPLISVTDRQGEAVKAANNPLAGGGWNGLTGLGVAAIALAVVTALLLHSAASVQSGRVDTAVARALGLKSEQLFLSLAAERWLMAGLAIAVGAAIGYWPGLELVQLLEVSGSGGESVPPMIPKVHGVLLASVLGGLIVAVMASVALGWMLVRRLSPVEVLREAG